MVQAELRRELEDIQRRVGCERITLWMLNHEGETMHNLVATSLGNSIIAVPFGVGIAGKAALSGRDVFVEDAYNEPDFNNSLDVATGYKTKAVCCVVLRKGDEHSKVIAVLQLINKVGGGSFVAGDAETIREHQKDMLPLLDKYEGRRASIWGDI